MDDFVVNVKQIFQYPLQTTATTGDAVLLQKTGGSPPSAGPYGSMNILDIVTQARQTGGPIALNPGEGISWGTAQLMFDGNGWSFNGGPVNVQTLNSVGDIFVNGIALADQEWVTAIFDSIATTYVSSFNGRGGEVQLMPEDILRAGGILQTNPRFAGMVIVPTAWDPRNDTDQAASCAFVQQAICWWLMNSPVVQSFNGRWGAVTLNGDDINAAYASMPPGFLATAPSPPLGDASNRIATTMFVDETMEELKDWVDMQIGIEIGQGYAPINSPNFTGVPTAPTANPGTTTGQLATTAFVQHAVTASTTGVASFNTRTGAVVLLQSDVTGVGAALLASPIFTGSPQAPTPTVGDNSQKIATTAFVDTAIAAAVVPTGVTSFNTRTGAVTLTTADVTGAGGAPLASPAMTGTPSAPTAAPGTNTTQLATTAFVAAAVAGATGGVSSFNSRTGAVQLIQNDISAVGGALTASPNFTGNPTAPTPTVGNSSQSIATTAFVMNAVSNVVVGVSSFNSRTGAVTLAASDVTGVGGALLNSPAFVGTPTAPTAAQTSNDTTVATTAYVRAALAAAPGGVSSFNSRTGAITLLAADVSGVGGALLASPAFTGSPTAPTAAAGATGQEIATSAWVLARLAAAGGVNSWNGRAGAVTMTATDIANASGAIYRQSDTAPSATPNTLWYNSLNGQLYVQYVDPVSSALSWVVANSQVQPAPAPGTRVLLAQQIITTAVATVDILYTFTNAYDIYELEIYNLEPVTNNVNPGLQVSFDGSTFASGATDYQYSYYNANSNNSSNFYGGQGSYLALTYVGLNNVAAYVSTLNIKMWMPWTTDRIKQFNWTAQVTGIGLTTAGIGGGAPSLNTSPLKGLRFLFSSGSVARGVFNLWGIVKAGAGAT